MRESLRAEFRSEGRPSQRRSSRLSYFGSIPVNQVRGDFRITGKGFGYRDRLHVPFESLNFSHVIQNFHLENSILI